MDDDMICDIIDIVIQMYIYAMVRTWKAGIQSSDKFDKFDNVEGLWYDRWLTFRQIIGYALKQRNGGRDFALL